MTDTRTSTPSQTQDQQKPTEPTILNDRGLTQNQVDSGETQSQRQDSDGDSDSDRSPDPVEIGDPVPEDQRTVRAETGEDEDLPGVDDDDGDTVDPDRDPSSERF